MISKIRAAEHTGSMPTVKRRKIDGTKVDVPCPPYLPDHQAFMRGVDRADQYMEYYNLGRQFRWWWKSVSEFLCFNPRKRRRYLHARITLEEASIDGYSA